MFKKLTEASKIGLISPAWIPAPERVEKGIRYLKQRGLHLRLSTHIDKVHGYFAGTDEERLFDIHSMYKDPEIDLILCMRGGWGGLRLLDRLDYQLIKSNPKPLVGYSDVTSLQLAIWQKSRVSSFSGPMAAVEMGKGMEPFTEKHFWNQLYNSRSTYLFDYSRTSCRELHKGRAKGILMGGCLSLVTTLLGTPYCPDYKGTILFLEDTGEKPYKIDRYFAHLRQAGVFEKVKAVILGEFLDCEPDAGEESFTVQEIISEYFSKAPYPVLYNFPYGHGDFKFTMPIGVEAELNTTKNQLKVANPFYR